jgi:hypothetical protein
VLEEATTMSAVARTIYPGVPAVAAHGSRVASIARVVTIVSAVFVTALLIGLVVASALGLLAEGHPGVGPDRPPIPMIVPRILV